MLNTWGKVKKHLPDGEGKEDMDTMINYHIGRLHKITGK